MKNARIVISVAVALAAVSLPSHARTTSAGDVLRARIVAEARADGFDPATILSRPAALRVWTSGGSASRATTIDDVLANMVTMPAGAVSGPLGAPEYVAGNITEAFEYYYFGPTSSAACTRLTVQTSSTIPETPFVPVTGAPLYATPVPGALSPVIPASSWVLPAYSAGGPTMHVTGSYDAGVHQRGTLIGSNVSTAPGAPSPAPVWLPMTHTALASDTSIDFLGHADVFQATLRFDLFGYTLCTTVGGVLLSDGAAIFDNHPVADQNVALPDAP